jgi:hypothetical protein
MGGVVKHLRGVADVRDEGFEDAGTRDFRGQARQSGVVGTHCEDVGALSDQAAGDRGAEVAAGAGEDDVFSREEHVTFLFEWDENKAIRRGARRAS